LTVVEIAKRAGVSIGTVDRVLHNRGRVSPETKERIQAIIDEEGYQPNPLARHLKRNRKYQIGVLIPELEKESRYWNLIHDGLLAAAGELAAFSFSIEFFYFERPNRDSLVSAFKAMTSSDCCSYIIAPVMQEETLVLLMDMETKVPYVFIDSFLPGANPVATVAQEPFRGGMLAGRIMELLAPGRGPYVVIRPYTEAFNLNERVRGFRDWFSAKPGVAVLDVVCAEADREQMYSSLDAVFDEHPDISGVFAVSSVGNKIVDYFTARNKKKNLAIIGYDLVAENVARLKKGEIDCLISQRPEEQCRLVMQQIYKKIVLEEEGNAHIDMPIDIFLKENLV
jgi:LacI family transcriptional regulator